MSPRATRQPAFWGEPCVNHQAPLAAQPGRRWVPGLAACADSPGTSHLRMSESQPHCASSDAPVRPTWAQVPGPFTWPLSQVGLERPGNDTRFLTCTQISPDAGRSWGLGSAAVSWLSLCCPGAAGGRPSLRRGPRPALPSRLTREREGRPCGGEAWGTCPRTPPLTPTSRLTTEGTVCG